MTTLIATCGIVCATAVLVAVVFLFAVIASHEIAQHWDNHQRIKASEAIQKERQHWISELNNIDRWCACEFPEIAETCERIQQHITNGKWESIDNFRERMRKLKKAESQ